MIFGRRLHQDFHLGQETRNDGQKEWHFGRARQAADDRVARGVPEEVHRGHAQVLPGSARPLGRPGKRTGVLIAAAFVLFTPSYQPRLLFIFVCSPNILCNSVLIKSSHNSRLGNRRHYLSDPLYSWLQKNGNCQNKIDTFLEFFHSVKPSHEK
jgi:hypothetical protein